MSNTKTTSMTTSGAGKPHRKPTQAQPAQRRELLRWAAGLGAVTGEALAQMSETTLQSARARLAFAAKQGLLAHTRPLRDEPALYTVTPAGLRACDAHGLRPCSVTASNARHLAACALVAARIQRQFPDRALAGERELRRDEADHGGRLASALLARGTGPAGEDLLHRPDLVLWPARGAAATRAEHQPLPIAVEVELTLKGRRRLEKICRAWARCTLVAGVVYLASPEVEPSLRRAIASADAGTRVIVLPLQALCGGLSSTTGASITVSAIASQPLSPPLQAL